MIITTYIIKKSIFIIAVLIPLLFIQNGLTIAYEDALTNAIVREKSDEIELIYAEIQNKLDMISGQIDALRQNSYMKIDPLERYWNDYRVIINSDGLNQASNAVISKFNNENLFYNEDEEAFWIRNSIDGTKQYNDESIIVLEEPIEDLFQLATDKSMAFGIIQNNEMVYNSDENIIMGNINIDNIELITSDTGTRLLSNHTMKNGRIGITFSYDITENINVINHELFLYNLVMFFLIVLSSVFFINTGIYRENPIQVIQGQLDALNEGIINKQLNKSILDSHGTMVMKYEIEKLFRSAYRSIGFIHELKSQIHQIKVKNKFQVEEQYRIEHSINKLMEEHTIAENVRDTLSTFVDQILVTVNQQLIITNVNDAYTNKLGYSSDEVIGKPLEMFISEVLDEHNIHKITSLSNEPIFMNLKYKNLPDSTSEFVSFKGIKWNDEHVLLIGKSIHDEITFQSQILRKNRELEYINQINASLISNWGFDELLDNIIRRIDFLFNVALATIYIKEDDLWRLKSTTVTLNDAEDFYLKNFGGAFIEKSSELSVIEIDGLNNFNNPFNENIKYLIVAPLEVENDIIAVMLIGLENTMKPSDLNVLRMFKNQASIVVQRAMLYEQLREQYFNTIEALVNVIEAKDKYTEGHSRRVSRFSVEIAQEMGYSNEELENIEIAGLLHDVGKVGINQRILNKRGKLTDEEYEIIKEHPEKGIQILRTIKLDPNIMEGIKFHHVHYNLRGYPANHDLNSLPKYAAIIGVADAFDAMSSARSYVEPRTIQEALNELKRCQGTQFDPEVVDAMVTMVKEDFNKIQKIVDDLRS